MKPNLDKIIQDNLDKVKFQSKLKPSLPKNTGWLDQYARGGTYISGKALATQFGQYQGGGQPPKKKIYTDKAEFDKAMQAKNDSLDAYRLSNQIKRIYPNLNEISKEKFNDIKKKDSLITHYDLDMVEYNKDKKKGITKPLNTYVYSRANGNYNDPIFLKNNQKELDKYSYNENDITKHSITLPNGDIKTPLTVYNGKPDWSDYSIQSTNGTLRTYFSNSNNNPELGNIRVENNKPIKTHYYGNDNPIPMGTITESSTGWYNGKKPDLKKLKDYKNYAYQSETIDEYQKPNTQPVYQPPTQNTNKSNSKPKQQTKKNNELIGYGTKKEYDKLKSDKTLEEVFAPGGGKTLGFRKKPVQPVVNQKEQQLNTPENWEKSIRDVEHKIGDPQQWTKKDYDELQNKLNDYKKWRETTPEGKAVHDSHNVPDEYVVPLPKHLGGNWKDGKIIGKENNLQVNPNTELIDRPLSKINTEQQPTNYSFHYPTEGTFDRANPQGVKYFKDRNEWQKFLDDNDYNSAEEKNGIGQASGTLKKGKYGGWLNKYEEGGPGDTYVLPTMPDLRSASESTSFQKILPNKQIWNTATSGNNKGQVQSVISNIQNTRKSEKETAAKELALRKQASQVMKQKGDTHFTFPNGDYKPYKDMNFRERSYVEGLALDQDTRLNEDEDSVVDFFNPLHLLGSLGKGLAQAPYVAKQTDSYLPYITGIGNPLLAGRMMGSGSMNPLSSKMWTNEISNKEFANILAGGIPGLIEKSAPKAISIGKTLYDIPRAESLKEAMGRITGIPLKKDIPRLLQGEVKPLRVVQDIGRLRAKGSSVAEQMKFALENKLPEEHFQKIFDRSKEEGQHLLDTGFGEQTASNHTGSIDLRRNAGQMITDDEIISALENHERQSQRNRLRDMFREIDQAESNSLPTNRDDRIVHTLNNLSNDENIANQLPSPPEYLYFDEPRTRRERTLIPGQERPRTSMLKQLKHESISKINKLDNNIYNKLDNVINSNIQNYPYYSGKVIQKVPNLHLNESEDMKKVFAKVFSAPEGIQSGDVFMGSDNTSHSSYLPQLKQVFKYTKGDPQFVGYKPMNTMGFLSKYGYEADDVAKYLNSEIDELIKRGKLPNNIQRPFLKEDRVILPQYGIKQHKYGGDISIPNLNKWLSKYEDGSVVDYLADKNQDFSYSHRKEIAKELGIENYRGTAEQNLKMLSMLKQASQPKEETEEVEQTDVQPSNVNPFVSFDNYSFNKPDVNIAPSNYSLSSASKTPSIAELKSKLVNRTKPQEAPVKKAVVVNNVKIPEYNPFNFINKPPAIDNTRNSKIPEYDPFGFIKALPPRGPAPANEKVNEKHWYDGVKDFVKLYYDIDNNIHEERNKYFSNLTQQGMNYVNRKFGKHNEQVSELVIPTKPVVNKNSNVIPVVDTPAFVRGKIIHLMNDLDFAPEIVDLNKITVGVRNRGDVNPLDTKGIIFGPVGIDNDSKDFKPSNTIKLNSNQGYVGVDNSGKIKIGYGDDFKNDVYQISPFKIIKDVTGFSKQKDDYELEDASQAQRGYFSPVLQTLKGDKEATGVLVESNKDKNKYGDITGGHVIFTSPDFSKKIVVSGSVVDIENALENFKKENDLKTVNFVQVDNGTYNKNVIPKKGKLTKKDLEILDNFNHVGNNFIYMKKQGGQLNWLDKYK